MVCFTHSTYLIVKKNQNLWIILRLNRTLKFCISGWNTNNITQNIMVLQIHGQLYILLIYKMQ